MSIETEFQSTIQNVQNAYNGLNNLGATIPQDKTIENIKSCLDEIYDNLPKTSYQEGTEITLSNTLKGKLDFDNGVVGIGQTEQDSTQGYQLISLKDGTYTGNSGVTIKVENGKCTINGTPSASEVIPVQLKDNYSLTNGQTYTLYGFNDVANSNVAFRPRIDEGFFQIAFDTTNKVESKTYNGTSISVAYIGIRVGSGTTITNLVCKPMLIIGNDTTKSYEKYTGGQASPSPNWEQPIEYVRGRNIWGGFSYSATGAQMTFTYNVDGTFLLNGTATSDATSMSSSVATSNGYTKRLKKGSYVLSGGTSLYKLQLVTNVNGYYDVTTVSEGSSVVVNLSNDCDGFLRIAVSSGTSATNQKIYAMLEQGSTPHQYLPYNTIEEVVSGKNKFGFGESVTDVTSTYRPTPSQRFAVTGINLNEVKFTYGGGNYSRAYLEIDGIDGTQNWNISYEVKENTTSYTPTFVQDTTNSTNNKLILIVNGNNGSTSVANTNYFVLSDIQIEQGSTATTYEPYITPKTYQFSLGDNKFYGIGTYRDTIRRSSGKNLWGGIGTIGSLSSGARTNSDGTIDISITGQGVTSATTPGAVQNNLTKILEPGTYTFTAKNLVTDMYCQIVKVNSATSGEVFQNISASPQPTTKTFTITENMEYFIRIQANTGVTFNGTIMPMIEQGSTATDYEPYGVGVWYKYRKIIERVFTGADTEYWQNGDYGTNSFYIAMGNAYKSVQESDPIMCISNLFRGIRFLDRATSGDNIIYLVSGGQIYIRNTSYTSVADFKNMLASNNLVTCYVAETPIIDIITGTLAEQLETWYNAHSLNGTTIITSNGDLPMIIKVRGLKGE